MKPFDCLAFHVHLFILHPPDPPTLTPSALPPAHSHCCSKFLDHASLSPSTYRCLSLPSSLPSSLPPLLPPSLPSFLLMCFWRDPGSSPVLPLFWVMTSSAAGGPGCSASVPARVMACLLAHSLARRCVSRNTLYPNADLIRPDCFSQLLNPK